MNFFILSCSLFCAVSIAAPVIQEQRSDLTDSRWSCVLSEKADGVLKRGVEKVDGMDHWFNRFVCGKSGGEAKDIQLWGPKIADVLPEMVLRVRMRSSIPFILPVSFNVLLKEEPWTATAEGIPLAKEGLDVGSEWKTSEFFLKGLPADGVVGSLHAALGGKIPNGAIFDFEAIGIWKADSSAQSKKGK